MKIVRRNYGKEFASQINWPRSNKKKKQEEEKEKAKQ